MGGGLGSPRVGPQSGGITDGEHAGIHFGLQDVKGAHTVGPHAWGEHGVLGGQGPEKGGHNMLSSDVGETRTISGSDSLFISAFICSHPLSVSNHLDWLISTPRNNFFNNRS